MPRHRRPTGRKAGRPTLVESVSAALAQSKSRAAKMLLAKIESPANEIPTGMLRLANDSVKDIVETAQNIVTAGDTPGEQAHSAIAQVLALSQYEVLPALKREFRDNPGKGVALWLEMVQYHLPKLSKQDITGSVQHQVSTFVPVEERRLDPIPLVKRPDGTYAESTED